MFQFVSVQNNMDQESLASMFLAVVLSFFIAFLIPNFLTIIQAIYIQVSISLTFYARILAPKNEIHFRTKKLCVKCWWNWH